MWQSTSFTHREHVHLYVWWMRYSTNAISLCIILSLHSMLNSNALSIFLYLNIPILHHSISNFSLFLLVLTRRWHRSSHAKVILPLFAKWHLLLSGCHVTRGARAWIYRPVLTRVFGIALVKSSLNRRWTTWSLSRFRISFTFIYEPAGSKRQSSSVELILDHCSKWWSWDMIHD